MAIGEQFAGLPMDQLIGAPLTAAADASLRLANSTADFINRVGFDANGNLRSVAFKYEKRSMNEDGTSNLDEMKVDVPMLAIVPIPNLQVDEVNILFDMEVKQSEKSESSLDVGATLKASANFGIVKVNVSGSVSVHQANTRSSDNSAKYHVDVRATNHGIPEGLARVLDMMAANVAPSLVGSTLKDGNGQNLTEQARAKAERLKALRQEIRQIETRLTAAQDGFDNSIRQLKRLGETQYNEYRGRINTLMSGFENLDSKIKAETDKDKREKLEQQKEQDEKKQALYEAALDELGQSWTNFQNNVAENVRIIAGSGNISEGVSSVFALKALDQDGNVVDYSEGSQYKGISMAQNTAIESQRNVQRIDTELFQKKAEYNDAIAGTSASGALSGSAAGNKDKINDNTGVAGTSVRGDSK